MIVNIIKDIKLMILIIKGDMVIHYLFQSSIGLFLLSAHN